MFDFSIVTRWFDELLRQTLGLGNFSAILIECVLVGVAIIVGYAVLAIILIFMERKVCAYFQCRIGPVRVGWWGTLQVFADVLKMLIKEIFTVDKADKLLYYLAPFLVIAASIGTFSFLPWNKGAAVLDFNVGIFLVTAISSIGVLGVFIAGWASNNKYSVLSAMRAAVQMISYELSLGICLISAVVLTRTMQISGIVEAQTGPWQWLIFQGHIPALLGFIVFCIA
ncbi:MAG: NADH-quinone oxidoreductase subunit H, partial [Prevotella sp.]